MTPEWKARVDAWLTEKHKDRSWLAEQLGVEPSTVKRMLEEQNTSALVARVCEITELPLPVTEVHANWEQETLDDLRQLAPEDRELVRAHIRRLKKDPR